MVLWWSVIEHYASAIVLMDHMDIVYLTQIHIGEHSKWLQSYNLWEYAFIEGDSSSESISFQLQVIYSNACWTCWIFITLRR